MVDVVVEGVRLDMTATDVKTASRITRSTQSFNDSLVNTLGLLHSNALISTARQPCGRVLISLL